VHVEARVDVQEGVDENEGGKRQRRRRGVERQRNVCAVSNPKERKGERRGGEDVAPAVENLEFGAFGVHALVRLRGLGRVSARDLGRDRRPNAKPMKPHIPSPKSTNTDVPLHRCTPKP